MGISTAILTAISFFGLVGATIGGADSSQIWASTSRARMSNRPCIWKNLESRYWISLPVDQLLSRYIQILSKNIRVLIYNGDADDCVPYKGNEEWTSGMADKGYVTPKTPWHPWYSTASGNSEGNPPAGYATEYTSPTGLDFSFVTIRLAGHMVPAFQPAAAFTFISRFLAQKPEGNTVTTIV